jgi:penicillin-binding protein 1A
VTWLLRLGLVVFAGALLVTAVVVAVAPRIWTVANAHDETPLALPKFQPLAQRSYAYDVFGNEISLFELENSQPIALAQIPKDVRDAFLAVEDKEFYTHGGVNMRSLVRATLSNFASDSPQQGASTITMQVVKNDFLSGLERDGRYKLLQVHYALMLERQYTKDQILERYLNTVFFGNNAYGVQAAAETYFGKTADQLTFIEAAFLAGLVRAPSTYDPVTSPERSRARFTQVLDRLVDDKYITQAQADELATTFVLPDRVRTIPQRTYARTYYTEALRDYLLNRSSILGATYAERYNTLFRGGLRIHTTFNPINQTQAEQARNVLPDTKQGFDASIVSLDTTSGAIRAMVGGKGFVPGEREVNMALSPRQTGSSIKFFVLTALLQAGAQPDDIVDGRNNCSFKVPDQPDFVIKDAVSRAPDTVAAMTWYSINCAYVRLAQVVGLNRMVDTVYRMAQSPYLYPGQPASERQPLQPYVSFSTGANEMAPIDMASGAQTIANGGLHHEPYYVDWIDTADGRRIYTHADAGTQVVDPGVALTAVDTLKGVLKVGTARRYPLADGRPAAGKTGTQADNTNAWFVGFTPQLTTAVWVGDPNGYTKMVGVPEFNQARVQGGLYPTQIWKTYMDAALQGQPLADWAPPPPDVRPPARLYLPGNECLARAVTSGGNVVGVVPGAAPPAGPAGLVNPQQAPPPAPPAAPPPAAPPPSAAPPASQPPTATVPSGPAPGTPITSPRVTRLVPVESGTTVPPNVLDPRAPVPSTPLSSTITKC